MKKIIMVLAALIGAQAEAATFRFTFTPEMAFGLGEEPIVPVVGYIYNLREGDTGGAFYHNDAAEIRAEIVQAPDARTIGGGYFIPFTVAGLPVFRVEDGALTLADVVFNRGLYTGDTWPTALNSLVLAGFGVTSSFSGTSLTHQGPPRTSLYSEPGSVRFERIDTAVPEPASWAMMIAGCGLVGAALRRQRQTRRTVLA